MSRYTRMVKGTVVKMVSQLPKPARAFIIAKAGTLNGKAKEFHNLEFIAFQANEVAGDLNLKTKVDVQDVLVLLES